MLCGMVGHLSLYSALLLLHMARDQTPREAEHHSQPRIITGSLYWGGSEGPTPALPAFLLHTAPPFSFPLRRQCVGPRLAGRAGVDRGAGLDDGHGWWWCGCTHPGDEHPPSNALDTTLWQGVAPHTMTMVPLRQRAPLPTVPNTRGSAHLRSSLWLHACAAHGECRGGELVPPPCVAAHMGG